MSVNTVTWLNDLIAFFKKEDNENEFKLCDKVCDETLKSEKNLIINFFNACIKNKELNNEMAGFYAYAAYSITEDEGTKSKMRDVLENNKVKLVNFSLAKIDYITLFTMASAETRHFHATDRRYMAPELRLDHHAATPGSDIFSAGVVLFELMTGQCPFDKRHPIQSETLLKRPTAFAEGLPDDIDHIFLKEMCCFDPDQRCASMEDVLELVGATIFQVSPHDQE